MHTKKVTAVMMVLFLVFAIAALIAGCGGGGGGGSTAAAPTPTPTPSGSVALLAKTALPGAASWGTHEISAAPGQTVLADIKITNNSGSATSPVALITLPSGNEVTLQAGSAYTEWTDASGARSAGKMIIERTVAERAGLQTTRSAGKSAAIADTITATATNLGYTLSANDWSYFYFNVTVASNATAGVKAITVTVNGVPATINVTVTTSGTTCPTITQPTCSANENFVAGAVDSNGCATLGTCVAKSCTAITQPTCGTGTHFLAGATDSNGCATVGTCQQDSCAAVTNPTCGTGYHSVTHNNVNGCPVANTCEADPVTQKGTIRASSNLEVASQIVTCPGAPGQPPETNHLPMVYDLGLYEKGWGYTVQMNAGACTVSCRNDIPNKVVDTAHSLMSVTLPAGGLRDLYCVYKDASGSGPVCGNHSQEAGEQCDDGNIANGDGCSSTCQNEGSGPGGPQL